MNRISPLYRLIFFIIEIFIVVLPKSIWQSAASLAFFALTLFFTDVKKKELFLPLYKARHFLMLIFFLNALFSESGSLFSWWIFRISTEGLINAFLIVYHVSLVTLIAYQYTHCSKIKEISDSIFILLFPLKLILIPVDKIAASLSLSLYLIDEFIKESERLKKIRKIRQSFEAKGLKGRALEYKSIVIPIFIMAFKRSDELSFALLSRGYNAKAKIRPDYLKPNVKDLVADLIAILVLIGVTR